MSALTVKPPIRVWARGALSCLTVDSPPHRGERFELDRGQSALQNVPRAAASSLRGPRRSRSGVRVLAPDSTGPASWLLLDGGRHALWLVRQLRAGPPSRRRVERTIRGGARQGSAVLHGMFRSATVDPLSPYGVIERATRSVSI